MPKSDNQHTGLQQLTFWVDPKQVEKLDKILDAYGYTSRAEWFREQLRVEIQQFNEAEKENTSRK